MDFAGTAQGIGSTVAAVLVAVAGLGLAVVLIRAFLRWVLSALRDESGGSGGVDDSFNGEQDGRWIADGMIFNNRDEWEAWNDGSFFRRFVRDGRNGED